MVDILTDEPYSAPVRSSDLMFEGRVWNVRRDAIDYGDATIVRDYVDHTGAVAVLALDDEDRALLIRQYRHPIRARDWEIPAGLRDLVGEAPLATAKRELAEEVDLIASDWATLVDLYTSPGGSSEMVRIYLARGLSPSDAVFERHEEELDIELRWVPIEQAVSAFLSRKVRNSILGVALLAAHAAREGGWAELGDPGTPWPGEPAIGD